MAVEPARLKAKHRLVEAEVRYQVRKDAQDIIGLHESSDEKEGDAGWPDEAIIRGRLEEVVAAREAAIEYLVEYLPTLSSGPALRVLAVLLFLDLATPDTINSFFYWAHVSVSAALFMHELAIAVALVLSAPRAQLVALLATQVAAGLLAMFSQFHLIGYLSTGILLYQLAFGALLVLGARDQLVEEEAALTMP